MTRQPKLKHVPNHEEPLILSKSYRWPGVFAVFALCLSMLVGAARWATAQDAKPSSPAPESDKQGKTQATPPPGAQSTAPVASPAQGKVRVMTPFGPMDFTAPVQTAAGQPAKDGQQPVLVQPAPQSSSAGSPGAASSNNQSGQSLPAGQQPPAQPQGSLPVPPTQTPANPPQSTTPAVSPPEKKPENAAETNVTLNLENADLYQVLRIIGSELRINYVVDPSVKGTVTINTSGSVSRANLFSVLESILQVNGAAIVQADGYYRIVPTAEAKLAALPVEYGKAPAAAPSPGDTLVLQVLPMRFVTATEMSKVLAPFISPAGQIVINERGSVLLVVETPAKLKQIEGIVDIFDSPTFSRARVHLFPITNNGAKDLVPELQNVFAGYALSANSAIRFVPIESLNAILAISPAPEVFKDIEEWINRLDQPARDVGLQNFVYEVQNAKASDLRDILIELYGGEVPKPQSPLQPTTPPNPMVSRDVQEAQQQAQLPPAPERVQGRIHIMSDNKNNALIFQATPHDYEVIKRTLIQLDLLPRQVLLDAKIYEVDLTGDLSLGISAFLQKNQSLTSPATSIGSFLAGQTGGSLQAQTFALIGATRTLQLFLNASENRSRVRTLSAPSILVTDNTSAKIQVGAEVPVPIGSALTPIQSGGTSIFAQTIQFMDTGVILTVTPHINASGIVMLNISQEVSSAVPNTTSQIVAPVINKSAFQTSVVLSDGEPLALGGIITTSNTLTKDRIPLLGDIPGLGALFGSTTKHTARTELVLLLTPHVLQDVSHAAANTKEFLNKMVETKKAMETLH
jgi:general secretion pathway protein D